TMDQLRNFRTPRLDLESLYGAGPLGSPYFYHLGDPDKLLIGLNDQGAPDDLPRNHQGRAIIADSRDDVHLIISQLHLAFLKFHNRTVDYVRQLALPGVDDFLAARRLVRWHYQWIVVHEFLPLIAGEETVQAIQRQGRRFYRFKERPFIPVEFSNGAYRYGHSQIRPSYQINACTRGAVFPDLAGVRPVPAARKVDWRYFFA